MEEKRGLQGKWKKTEDYKEKGRIESITRKKEKGDYKENRRKERITRKM